MSTPETLLAALDAASSDAERLALFSGSPRDVRRKANVLLQRAQFLKIGAAPDEYKDFGRQLDALDDDAQRLALIEAARSERGAAWLGEALWRLTATADDWRQRYLKAAGIESYTD